MSTAALTDHPAAAAPASGRRHFGPYLRAELMRRVRDGYSLVFILALPSVMYLMFGAFTEYGDQSAGHGTVSFYVLVSMATYGAVTAMTSLTATVALEAQQGWQRQLQLTGLGIPRFVAIKTGIALALTAIGALGVLAVGAVTGASADSLGIWVGCFALILLTAPVFGVYGLAIALIFRSDGAVGLASALLTLFAFFGNMFLPLEGIMLDIARFTPLYGIAALVRWPVTEGYLATGGSDPLWLPIVNAVAWLAVFTILAILGGRRSTARS